MSQRHTNQPESGVLRRSRGWVLASMAVWLGGSSVSHAQDVPWGHQRKAEDPVTRDAEQQPAPVAEKRPRPTDRAAPATAATEVPDASPTPAGPRCTPKGDVAPPSLAVHEHLAPHGSWVEHARFGTIWVPSEESVGKGFTPYVTGGHWAVAESGAWTWLSDHDWGRIPFHFGRWVWTRDHAWAWIPGNEYAPAWVVWRIGEAQQRYVGWAPMAPLAYWIDNASVRQSHGVLPFTFVAAAHLFDAELSQRVVKSRDLATKLHARSYSFRGHFAEGLTFATPSVEAAGLPDAALPTTRVTEPREELTAIVMPTEEARAACAAAVAPKAVAEDPAEAPTGPDEQEAEASEGAEASSARAADEPSSRYCWYPTRWPRTLRCREK